MEFLSRQNCSVPKRKGLTFSELHRDKNTDQIERGERSGILEGRFTKDFCQITNRGVQREGATGEPLVNHLALWFTSMYGIFT